MSLKGLKEFGLGFALALLAVPALAASISVASTTAVQIAAASATRATHVQAYSLVAAGTTTVQLEYGTQVTNPCDTGAVVLTGAMSMGANNSLTAGNGGADLFIVPAGKQFCIVQTGAVQLSGFVTYTQH